MGTLGPGPLDKTTPIHCILELQIREKDDVRICCPLSAIHRGTGALHSWLGLTNSISIEQPRTKPLLISLVITRLIFEYRRESIYSARLSVTLKHDIGIRHAQFRCLHTMAYLYGLPAPVSTLYQVDLHCYFVQLFTAVRAGDNVLVLLCPCVCPSKKTEKLLIRN